MYKKTITALAALLAFVIAAVPQAFAARTAGVRVSGDTLAVVDRSAAEIMNSPVDDLLAERLGQVMDQRIDERISELPARKSDGLKMFGVAAVFGLPFVFAVLLLFVGVNYLNRRGERRARLIELSLQRGQPLPPEFYRQRRPNRVQSGLMWLAWGAGLMIFFGVVGADPAAALMSVPCLIGVSKLLTVLIESRKGGPTE